MPGKCATQTRCCSLGIDVSEDKCPLDEKTFEKTAEYWNHLKECHPNQIYCCPHPDCGFATFEEDVMKRQFVLHASFAYILLTLASNLRAHK